MGLSLTAGVPARPDGFSPRAQPTHDLALSAQPVRGLEGHKDNDPEPLLAIFNPLSIL
jgi:hypothetical protein